MTPEPTTPTTPIPLTAEELASICEALRYMAAELDGVSTFHRRNEVSALRGLAWALEHRWELAVGGEGVGG